MYSITDYSWMMEDKVRVGAYMAALRKVVKPGDVVVDLGAGVGTWAFICCQLGARKVYAIEVSGLLHLARQISAANGFSDRIELIQEFSTAVALPEKVDVIVFEIHGQQPMFKGSLNSIIDARKRFLKSDGILMPGRETLWAAAVEAPATYEKRLGFWERPFEGIDMRAGRSFATDWLHKAKFAPDQVITNHVCYAELDYYQLEDPDVVADFTLTVNRASTGHGLHIWFDSELTPGIGYSNGPGHPETIFCGSFLPWPEPVRLEPADEIRVSLGFRMTRGAYVWSIATRIFRGDQNIADFNQSEIRHHLPRLKPAAEKLRT